MVAEKGRDLIADQVAQDAPETAGDDPHEDGHQGRLAGHPGQVDPCGAEQAQPDGVRNPQPSLTGLQAPAPDEDGAAGAEDEDRQEDPLVLDEEKGSPVDQDVPQHPAAKGRQEAADADSDQVHPLAQGAQHPREGAGQHGHHLEGEEGLLAEGVQGRHGHRPKVSGGGWRALPPAG